MEFKMRSIQEAEFFSTLAAFSHLSGVNSNVTEINRDRGTGTSIIIIQDEVIASFTSEQVKELKTIQ